MINRIKKGAGFILALLFIFTTFLSGEERRPLTINSNGQRESLSSTDTLFANNIRGASATYSNASTTFFSVAKRATISSITCNIASFTRISVSQVASVGTGLYVQGVRLDTRNLTASKTVWYDATTKSLKDGPSLGAAGTGKSLGYPLPGSEAKSAAYVVVGSVIWPGTLTVGNPGKFIAISWMNTPLTDYSVRLYDLTNGATIIEKLATNTTKIIKEWTGFSNVTATSAIWEVQIKRSSGGGKVQLEAINISFTE